ncbi:MAG: class II aldolase/adducin family protein [Anaerotruncus massiliensis (ex Togo et al. 2019)]
MLYELGFSPSGDNGDISVRDPETGLVYISASPIEIGYKNLGEYHACDMAVVDMEGNRMTTWSRPTIEMPMHLAILRARPDVNAVVHTHAAWSSVFAICGKNIPFVLAEQYAHLGAGESSAPDTAKRVPTSWEEIVSALGKNNAVLMRNHGAVTVGAPSTKRLPTPVSSNASPRRRCSPPARALQTVNPEDVAEEWAK